MHDGWIRQDHDPTTLVGKLIGRHEGSSIALRALIVLLEDKGILAEHELDDAVAGFLRARGREYLVEQWGETLGSSLYDGLTASDQD
ncbi:MAG TPA: hypothetical protein VID73_13170 [Ktedonobacterales bacterium]|jgi:hypothetical protein